MRLKLRCKNGGARLERVNGSCKFMLNETDGDRREFEGGSRNPAENSLISIILCIMNLINEVLLFNIVHVNG